MIKKILLVALLALPFTASLSASSYIPAPECFPCVAANYIPAPECFPCVAANYIPAPECFPCVVNP